MIDSIILRIQDAFTQHPLYSLYFFLGMTFLIYLCFDFFKLQNNQVSRQVKARIGNTDEEKKKDKIMEFVQAYLAKQEHAVKLKLEKANLLIKPREYFSVLFTGAGIGALIGFSLFPLPFIWKALFLWVSSPSLQETFGRLLCMVAIGFVGSYLPKLWLMFKIRDRTKKIEIQIGDALLNIADALKSGHVIQEALKIVGDDTSDPLGHEFRRTYQEIETGRTLEQALFDLKERVDIKDFQMALNAIEIQTEVGGKLEPLLRNIVKIIADRQELKREIDKTISQSKMVGIVLLCAPIFFMVVFFLINKEQMMMMFTIFIGQMMLVLALLCYIGAAAIIVWIIRNVSKDL